MGRSSLTLRDTVFWFTLRIESRQGLAHRLVAWAPTRYRSNKGATLHASLGPLSGEEGRASGTGLPPVPASASEEQAQEKTCLGLAGGKDRDR